MHDPPRRLSVVHAFHEHVLQMGRNRTDEKLKANMKNQPIWQRLSFMVLFAVIFDIAEFVVLAVAVVQFVMRLATGRANIEL